MIVMEDACKCRRGHLKKLKEMLNEQVLLPKGLCTPLPEKPKKGILQEMQLPLKKELRLAS